MINLNNDKKGKVPFLKIWFGFFIYAGLMALAVQFIVLPYIFPSWHAGNGLLLGLDCVWFHELAVELAQKIHAQGWSAWELRPSGQATAGIAGAIYAISVPKPWTIIPLNAALHATAAFVLLRIVLIFTSRWRIAILFILPFLMYPSALTWYSQNHKDGYSILGTFLFVYGWLLFARMDTWKRGWWQPCKSILLIICGTALCWIVRPYLVEILQVEGILLAMFATGTYVVWVARHRLTWHRAILSTLLVWITVSVMNSGISSEISRSLVNKSVQSSLEYMTSDRGVKVDDKKIIADGGEIKTDDKKIIADTEKIKTDDKKIIADTEKIKTDDKKIIADTEKVKSKKSGRSSEHILSPMSWMIKFAKIKLSALADQRTVSLRAYPYAKSNIDQHLTLRDMNDCLSYIPRAAQIAFLSPFPNIWFKQGSSEQSTLMRKISAFEMIIVYIALFGIPFAVLCFYRRPEFWVILVFCSSIMLVFAFAFPNAGSLYRMRYGFMMMLVAIGLMGFYAFWQKLQKKHRSAGKDARFFK